MAIKIDCLKCSKRISIDEAFAGGVCRCPYCRAINNVPGRRGPKAFFPRPVAPPDETAGMRQAATHAEVAPEDIPMADRVVFQGIATIILMLMLLTLVVAGVAVVITSVTGNKPNGPNGGPGPDVQPNPFLASKPQTVAGNVSVKPPVIYCIDAGSAMRPVFNYAIRMTAASIDSLGGGTFGVVIAEEGQLQVISGDELSGGGDALLEATRSVRPAGVGDVESALHKALTLNASTVVLFSRTGVAASSSAAEAKQLGAKIVTVCLDGNAPAQESLAELAEQTGGKTRAFGAGQLKRWAEEAE